MSGWAPVVWYLVGIPFAIAFYTISHVWSRSERPDINDCFDVLLHSLVWPVIAVVLLIQAFGIAVEWVLRKVLTARLRALLQGLRVALTWPRPRKPRA